MIRSFFRLPAAIGLLAAVLGFGWQALTVHANYGGNWTGLFCIGSEMIPPPPSAAQGLYVFQGTPGYDGQFYRIIARDPFLRTDAPEHIDSPSLRYRRILMPVAAWLLSGGQSGLADGAYLAVNLLFVALGAWWLSQCAVLAERHAAWGLAFLAVPAVIAALDRVVLDGALAALIIGFVLYLKTEERWKLYGVLVAAALLRETGVVLAAGLCLSLLFRRRFREVLLFASAVLPTFAWYVYVHFHTHTNYVDAVALEFSNSVFERWLVPLTYARGGPVAGIVIATDYISLAGGVAALLLAAWVVLRKKAGAIEIAGVLYALVLFWVIIRLGRYEPYAFPRLASPILILLAMRSFSGMSLAWAVPLAMVSLRAVVQVGPQILGIVRSVVPGM
ncbi:MAG: hypothetical protein ABFD89_20875 [Bryobacteraceae bacterium]